MPMEESRDLPPELDEAFAEFVARRDMGEDLGLETFCKERPDLEGLIREHWDEWQRVVQVLEKLEAGKDMSAWLSARYGKLVDPGITLGTDGPPGEMQSTGNLLERLWAYRPRHRRYRLHGEVARGGMGAVLRVWDEDLRRNAAMKVMIGKRSSASAPQEAASDSRAVERFLEEAQVTAQLDHPGIVTVHELGIDSNGHIYFTMPFVKGRNLSEIIGLVHQGREGWTQIRALGVIIKVCEAVAYAHAKGVAHRDLKPSNVMVGRFGETYVMDWGLAKVMGREDTRDLRLRTVSDSRVTVIATDRQDLKDQTPDSPLMTLDGHVLGTPAYMPPEQAQGMIEKVGPRSDIYSIGAMLYQLLTGQMPYVPKGAKLSPHTVLGMVVAGPPQPLEKIAPETPAELAAICEKAMARNPEERYGSAMEMAQDVENFLGRRPVGALPSSPRYLFKLFVERNRAVALTAAGALVVLVTFVAFFISNLQQAVDETSHALDSMQRAYDRIEVAALLAKVEDLYPLVPARAVSIAGWLERTDGLLARQPLYQRELEGASSSGGLSVGSELSALLASLGQLADLRPRIAANLEAARGLWTRTVENEEATWEKAITDIYDLEIYHEYQQLDLTPQLGLIPLGRSRQSGLWEFWHVLSGERPSWDEERGEARLAPGSGIVLVLIPGGAAEIGAREDDPWTEPNERLHQVVLEPFFISKYEVTQAQWERIMGSNPSQMNAGRVYDGETFGPLNPVETITWFEADRFARRLDLLLPTEAQWEWACRAGTDTPFCWGAEAESLEGKENIRDLSFERATGIRTSARWNDGHRHHAAVGSFAPNGWGLYDVLGNVVEWCRDSDVQRYPPDSDEPGDGLMAGEGADPWRRATRGGSWWVEPIYCRSAFRGTRSPYNTDFNLGLRLVRPVHKGESGD